jgi:dsDNA-specific endonuclease/ATPase MutS2
MIVWNRLSSHSNSTKQMRENIRAAEEVAQTSKTEAEEARKKVEEERRNVATARSKAEEETKKVEEERRNVATARRNKEQALRKAEEETTKRLELEEEVRRLRAQFGVPERA